MRVIGTSPNQSGECRGVRFYRVPGHGMVSEDLHPGIAQQFLNIPSIYAVYDGPDLTLLPPSGEHQHGQLVISATASPQETEIKTVVQPAGVENDGQSGGPASSPDVVVPPEKSDEGGDNDDESGNTTVSHTQPDSGTKKKKGK